MPVLCHRVRCHTWGTNPRQSDSEIPVTPASDISPLRSPPKSRPQLAAEEDLGIFERNPRAWGASKPIRRCWRRYDQTRDSEETTSQIVTPQSPS